MKRKYIGAIPVVAIITFAIFLEAQPTVPDAPAKEIETTEAEAETETKLIDAMNAYLDSKAAEQNKAILEAVTEDFVEETSPETTEAVEEFTPIQCIDLNADLQKEIKALCDEYEIDFTFFIGWMFTESRCHWSIGPDNDTGYMQIIPRFHEADAAAIGINIYDELGNCEYAMVLLNTYLTANDGDLRKALQQYNTGSPDTANGYAERVFENVEYIREEADE